MTITLEAEIDPEFDFDYEVKAKEVILAAIEAENFPFEAEVDVTLTDNETIHEMNRMYREVDRPTDVLSFPLLSYDAPGDFSKLEDTPDNFNPDTGEAMLGDIVLSVPKIKEQAAEYGHSELREYCFLILHSMLHLFGYDHMTEDDAAIMINKQKDILNHLGILR